MKGSVYQFHFIISTQGTHNLELEYRDKVIDCDYKSSHMKYFTNGTMSEELIQHKNI